MGLIEASAMGGTCVNVGCVPKKVMFNAATVAEILHDSKQFGFEIEGYKFNWNHIKVARDAYIARLNGIYTKLLGNSKVNVINGRGSFVGPREVDVGGVTYTAENICIAVGGKPIMPNIPGVEHCLTSDGFFALEHQPSKVAVIGGGYIGVELAGVFHGLGTKTELLVREGILPSFDDIIVTSLEAEMKKQGLVVRKGASSKEIIKHSNGQLTIRTESGEELGPYDQIVMATGRVPNIDKLNLSKAGVTLEKKGYIEVDEFQRTKAAGGKVHALGDACGKVQLTPMAIAAGRRLADRLFGGMPDAKADYDNVPTVVFTHPVIGTVGMTEKEARAKYGDANIKVYTSTFTNLWYGTYALQPEEKPKTAMKLITLLPQEKVLGIHMIGMGCDEALQGFAVALKMGATKADLDRCIALHPTAAEELVTLAPWGMSPQ